MRKLTAVTALAFAALGAGAFACADPLEPPIVSPAHDGTAFQAASPDLRVQAWHGDALCYSGYRAGQTPKTEIWPTPAQVVQDLRIIERQWKLIRIYGADRHSEDVLEAIRSEKLPLKVLLGIWLDGKLEDDNARQIAAGIRLANAYPDVVVAVNVGNEAFVSWSDHKMSEERGLELVRQVKAAVRCPVTVADDQLYWREPSAKLAAAVDFIAMHTYPVWGKHDIDEAMPIMVADFERVRRAHPGKAVVITEAGWPSFTDSPQNAPRAGDEAKQKRHYQELTAWAKANAVTVFWFEAFDEPWKGQGTEGHWGLFTEARKAKPVMQGRYPELKPDGPTSPGYAAAPDAKQAGAR
jgi:exo-beta-1,3-glucanase (GH17 family)